MEPQEASRHIYTDKIMLFDGKRVSDIKSEYIRYHKNGGKLRKKEYLDKVANEKIPGYTWDQIINYSKEQMHKIFYNGETNGWLTKKDHWELARLAQSGHAVAAYNLGCQFIKQDDDLAVRALIDAHNYGHVGALYRLSGYLAHKGNFKGAIICLIIAADCGSDIAVMAIPHIEAYKYIWKSLEYGEIEKLVDNLADASPHSTARYIQVMTLLLRKDNRCINKIEDIVNQPMKQPKRNEVDDTYIKRETTLKQFFNELKIAISDDSGKLLCSDNTGELLDLYTNIANSKRYHFVSYKDFMELDTIFNP
jgi:hypothetical protein